MQSPIAAVVRSPFGWRRIEGRSDLHTGQDYPAPIGTHVHAASAGVVQRVYAPAELANYGLTVILKHPATPAPLWSLYAHLSAAHVEQGQAVAEGQHIADVGNSAGNRAEPSKRTRAPHLHFELLTRWPPRGLDQDRIDPAPYLTPSSSPRSTPSSPSEWTTPARASAGAGALLAFLALVWYYTKTNKKRRPSLHSPAQDHPTQPGDQWPA